jgi:hypothetical protein
MHNSTGMYLFDVRFVRCEYRYNLRWLIVVAGVPAYSVLLRVRLQPAQVFVHESLRYDAYPSPALQQGLSSREHGMLTLSHGTEIGR